MKFICTQWHVKQHDAYAHVYSLSIAREYPMFSRWRLTYTRMCSTSSSLCSNCIENKNDWLTVTENDACRDKMRHLLVFRLWHRCSRETQETRLIRTQLKTRLTFDHEKLDNNNTTFPTTNLFVFETVVSSILCRLFTRKFVYALCNANDHEWDRSSPIHVLLACHSQVTCMSNEKIPVNK
jgi:hypothetical protein